MITAKSYAVVTEPKVGSDLSAQTTEPTVGSLYIEVTDPKVGRVAH